MSPSKNASARARAERSVADLLRRPYSRQLTPEAEGGFSAQILEFPGCFAEGDTVEETYANLEDAARSWLLAVMEKGDAVPSPLEPHENSGRFALRLSRSLYARAAQAAARDNVSMNQFISNAVAVQVGEAAILDRVERLVANVRRRFVLEGGWRPNLGVAETVSVRQVSLLSWEHQSAATSAEAY